MQKIKLQSNTHTTYVQYTNMSWKHTEYCQYGTRYILDTQSSTRLHSITSEDGQVINIQSVQDKNGNVCKSGQKCSYFLNIIYSMDQGTVRQNKDLENTE
jgi:hypothetical protein